jgi:hypothetical protein
MSDTAASVSVTVAPPPAVRETLSPFVRWDESDRAPLPDELLHQPERRSIATDLLRSPEAIIDQLASAAGAQRLILGAIGWIALGTFAFVLLQHSEATLLQRMRGAPLMALHLLAAVAATLGPIYGTSLLQQTRIPMTRLVATLVASMATGTILLGALAPLLSVIGQRGELQGPLATGIVFVLAGGTAGKRIHRLLVVQAESINGGTLSSDDAYRVGIVARVACVLLGLCTALVFRGLDLFHA